MEISIDGSFILLNLSLIDHDLIVIIPTFYLKRVNFVYFCSQNAIQPLYFLAQNSNFTIVLPYFSINICQLLNLSGQSLILLIWTSQFRVVCLYLFSFRLKNRTQIVILLLLICNICFKRPIFSQDIFVLLTQRPHLVLEILAYFRLSHIWFADSLP